MGNVLLIPNIIEINVLHSIKELYCAVANYYRRQSGNENPSFHQVYDLYICYNIMEQPTSQLSNKIHILNKI